MFDKLKNTLDLIQKIAIIAFYISLVYCLFSIVGSIKNIESDILISTLTIRKEIPIIRDSLFSTVDKSVSRIDNRVASVEKNLFKRIDSIEGKTFSELEKVNIEVHQTVSSIDKLTQEYSKVPQELFKISKNLEPNINCQINDYCWPNLFSDLLIDSRNMVRDGSKTFNLVNKEVPKLVSDFNKVSTSLADGIPKVTDNTTKITDNIQRLTKPKWYDRALGVGANASLIYFNVLRTK